MATTSSIDLPTSPTKVHRVDAPEWPLHVFVAHVTWALAVIGWAWAEKYEMPTSGKHVWALAGGLGILGCAVLALIAIALGA